VAVDAADRDLGVSGLGTARADVDEAPLRDPEASI
jgi:hypothetical protein